MCLFWPSWIFFFSVVCTGISFLRYIETATMALSNISALFKKIKRNVKTTLFLLTTQDLRYYLWGNFVRFFFHTVSLFSSAVNHTFNLQSEWTKDHTLSTSASVCCIFDCPLLVSSFHHSLKCVCHLKSLNSMFTINILSGVNISQAVLLIFTWNLTLIHCSRFFSLIFHQQYKMNM